LHQLLFVLLMAHQAVWAEAPHYGASADGGETGDPLVDHVRYRGDVYYVGCTSGSDLNDGHSPASAWRSLEKVNEFTEVGYWDTVPGNGHGKKPNARVRRAAPSGSAFLFERGCRFDGYINVHAILPGKGHRPDFSENLTFDAYGDRGKARPVIEALTPPEKFRATVWSNGHSIHVRNLHLVGHTLANKPGVWLRKSTGSSVENTLIENMGGDGVQADDTDDVLIRNSEFRNNQLSGRPGAGLAGSGRNLRVLNNTFLDNGRHRILAHSIYLRYLTNASIQGNRIEGGSNLGIVLHGTCDGVQIIGNDIFGNSNGIDLSGGHPKTVESFDKVVIERNRIHDNGMRPKEQGYGLLLKSLRNSAIRNNLIYGNRVSPMAFMDKNPGDPPSSNVTIEHNVFDSPSGGLSFKGDGLANVVMRDNIVVVRGSSSAVINKDASVPDAALTLEGGLYFAPHLDPDKLIRWGTRNYDPAGLATALGQKWRTVVTDPLFVNASAGDYSLQPRSPARKAGVPTDATTDFAGSSRDRSAPSIGAFE
jgi:parallel beta-helix repeat protein